MSRRHRGTVDERERAGGLEGGGRGVERAVWLVRDSSCQVSLDCVCPSGSIIAVSSTRQSG